MVSENASARNPIGEQFGQPVRDPCELAFERIGGFQDGRARLAELSQRPCHCAPLVSQAVI